MKNKRRIIPYIVYIVLGAVLFVCGILRLVDSFWSGMGGALIAVGAVRTAQYFRYYSDKTYREKHDVELNDERNRFISNKAWALSGYIFVLIAAISTIVLKLLGHDLLSLTASLGVCILLTLYWICYLILRKKY